MGVTRVFTVSKLCPHPPLGFSHPRTPQLAETPLSGQLCSFLRPEGTSYTRSQVEA